MTAPAARPRIGITTSRRILETPRMDVPIHSVPRAYVAAVEAAGGLPVILPNLEADSFREYAGFLDGVILTGGEDVDPALYGADRHPETQKADDLRDSFESAAVNVADEIGLPALCICRGIQVLNVARGGSLIQDIPSEVEGGMDHYPDIEGEHAHDVTVEADSLLGTVYGKDRLQVNSRHHQAVLTVGRHLKAVAWAPEGFVEAIEDDRPGRFLIGVQWHPETMFEAHPEQLAPFRALVEATR
jgi:putative glutamine amidotransferase